MVWLGLIQKSFCFGWMYQVLSPVNPAENVLTSPQKTKTKLKNVPKSRRKVLFVLQQIWLEMSWSLNTCSWKCPDFSSPKQTKTTFKMSWSLISQYLSFVLTPAAGNVLKSEKHPGSVATHGWKMSRSLVQTIWWFHAYKSYNTVLNSGLWL